MLGIAYVSPTERRRSIRLRLTLASAAMAALLVALTLTAVYFSTQEIIEMEVDDDLEAEIADLVDFYRKRGLAEFAREIQRRSSGLSAHRGYYFFSEERLQRIAGNLEEWPEEADHETTWTDCSRSPNGARSNSCVSTPRTGIPSISWITSSGFVKPIQR